MVVASAQAGSPARQPSALEAAPGTTFTYQGRLNLDDQPVNNTCDFQFSLYDDALGNVQIGATQTITEVALSGGLFTVQLDFEAEAFRGDARWLGIQVQCQGDAAYTDLGLQALTATPYALALPGLWTQQNATSPNLSGWPPWNPAGWRPRPSKLFCCRAPVGC